MSTELEIYLKNIRKFFNDNPQHKTELFGEFPNVDFEDFMDIMRLKAEMNLEEKGDPVITKTQMIEILFNLNGEEIVPDLSDKMFMHTIFGSICLN